MADKFDLREKIFGAEENSAAKLDPEKRGRFQEIAMRMFHTRQLPAKETAYSVLAGAGRKLSDNMNGYYRNYFYVTVLRIDMVYVALIQTLISIYDVLNNPLMGIAFDRTRTRWGKARPYALLTAPPYYASMALLLCGRVFFNNDNTRDPRKILFVFAVLFLQETFATIFKIPVDNYPTMMTPNPKDRMSMGLWLDYSNRWVGDVFSFMFVPFLDMAKSGFLNVPLGVIFAFLGVFSSALGAGGSMLQAVHCHERIMLQPQPADFTKTIFYILKNKYEMRKFVGNLAGNWWTKGSMPWETIANLEIWGGWARTFPWMIPIHAARAASLPLVEPFKRMFGGSYRKTVIFMRAWDMVFASVPALLGFSKKVIGTWWKPGLIYCIFNMLTASNDQPSTVLENEINREIGDYTEYVTGERPDGTIGLLTGLLGQVTAPLQTLMAVAVIRWAGYDPNIGSNKRWNQELVRQNSSMYSRVNFLHNIADIVPVIFRTIPLFFYDLDGEKKEEMYIALNERRALIAKENAMPQEMETLMEMMVEEETTEGKG